MDYRRRGEEEETRPSHSQIIVFMKEKWQAVAVAAHSCMHHQQITQGDARDIKSKVMDTVMPIAVTWSISSFFLLFRVSMACDIVSDRPFPAFTCTHTHTRSNEMGHERFHHHLCLFLSIWIWATRRKIRVSWWRNGTAVIVNWRS